MPVLRSKDLTVPSKNPAKAKSPPLSAQQVAPEFEGWRHLALIFERDHRAKEESAEAESIEPSSLQQMSHTASEWPTNVKESASSESSYSEELEGLSGILHNRSVESSPPLTAMFLCGWKEQHKT